MKKYATVLFFLIGHFCWAIDTTEIFSQGLSDLELHSEIGKTESSMTGVVGYGYSTFVNPSLAFTRLKQTDEEKTITEIEIGNFANVYDGFVDIDLVIGATVHEDEQSSPFAGTELTTVNGRFMPFLKNIFEIAAQETSSSSSIGMSFQGNKETELFAESTWDLSNGQHTCLAVGLNYHSSLLGMEVISEVGQKSVEEESYASLGAIWTLE